jgi:putative ABC transport system substrate-binding protein
MKRRDFITLLGVISASSFTARAQQSATPVIGVLHGVSATQWTGRMVGFHRGLGEAGFAEGRNLAIEYRWAEGQFDRLPAMATDLISRKVAVICAGAGDVAIRAAMAATKTTQLCLRPPPIRCALGSSLASVVREETSPAPLLWVSSWSPSGWSCYMRYCPASLGSLSL